MRARVELSDPFHKRVHEALLQESKNADELCDMLDVGIADVAVALSCLEISGHISVDDSMRYHARQ